MWARAMTPQKDEELIHYFHDRKVWLLDADERPAKLEPYGVTASKDARRGNVATNSFAIANQTRLTQHPHPTGTPRRNQQPNLQHRNSAHAT